MEHKRTLLFLAVILMAVGAILTLENLGLVTGVSRHWPIFLLILGTGFLLLFQNRSGADAVLLWLGIFIGLLGGFFYFLNFTRWSLLGRLWPVFLGLVGLSFSGVALVRRSRLFLAFAIIFIGLFLIFTLVFAVSLKLWPLSLFVFGAALLILDIIQRKDPRP